MPRSIYSRRWRTYVRDQPSEPSHQKQDDDQHQSQATTGPVAPTAAMRPVWDGADQHQYQNDQQNGSQSHGSSAHLALDQRGRMAGVAPYADEHRGPHSQRRVSCRRSGDRWREAL